MQMNSSSIQEKVDFLAFLGFTFPIPLAYQLAEILIHKHSYEMTCFDAIHIWKVSAYIINFFFFSLNWDIYKRIYSSIYQWNPNHMKAGHRDSQNPSPEIN